MNIRQAIWEYISSHPNCRAEDLSAHLDIPITPCRNAIHGLIQKGLIHKTDGTGHVGRPFKYQVSTDEPPVWGKSPGGKIKIRSKKTNRQKLWNNMKISKKFTVSDLLSTLEIGENTARNYLTYLVKGGYVIEKSRAPNKKRLSPSSGKEIEWFLIKDTGRLAPIVRHDGLWDQNEQKFYPFK
ncbi:hypothetical protein [Vibrio quintilis]|uniref:Sugar-specific transcriptional regulator TrmB n=1 Tax=Vibrio quintilis TaxID=1117707 RepID=A0A1M7YTU5_9VIBR|nr:hypothetical protein [Vibrio quintilis]SHO56074.1 Sugar-specific transcriptional regulator TrmB [Vibrio quintilis]